MLTIRSSIYFALLVLSVIIAGSVMSVLGWILPFETTSRIANQWGRLNLFFLRLFCNLDYKLTGWENIPKGGAIIMSKHQSAWETIALRGLLPPKQAWVLKRELMYVPVFGWALATVRPIAINRKSGRNAVKQVIEQGTKALEQGKNVVIFPEGTRTAPGQRKKYGMGGGLLAEKSGYPVIPIAHNAGVFWKRRDLIKYPGTIQVIVGEPIQTKGKTAQEITKEVETWIEAQQLKIPGSL